MVTGVIKNKVDKIWTDIWAGGITNPLTVIEQLTYLMFIRSLDEKELETEEFENMTGELMDKIFPQTPTGQSMRWSRFKDRDPGEIYDVISKRVFPAIKKFKNGHLPDFTAQGELIEIEEDGSGDESKTAFSRYMDLDLILSELIERRLPSGQVWNVNFPDVPLSSCKGILWDRNVSPAVVYEDRYEEESLPDGSRRFMVKGTFLEKAEEGTDFRALLDGYVSVGIVRNIGFMNRRIYGIK